MSAIAGWVLSLLFFLEPRAPWAESFERTAVAIAHVVETEEPLFKGERGRERTATALVALLWFESTGNPAAVGDRGRSFGLYQIQRSNLSEGVTERAMMEDPELATREALRLVRTSMRICKRERPEHALAWYAVGRNGCSSAGFTTSRHRVELGRRLFTQHPFVDELDVD